MRARLALGLASLALAACSQPSFPSPVRHLDRPSDLAFACLGFTPAGDVQALTPASCGPAAAGADAGPADGGVDAMPAPSTIRQLAFIVEPVRGDITIADTALLDFVDSDKLAPGLNGLAVGRLPTSVAMSGDGCHAIVTNSGSCDLSLVDVVTAYQSLPGAVTPREPRSTAGPLRSRPSMVATLSGPATDQPSACNPEGSGFAWVAFESCHLVARVDLATGQVVDGVHSPPDGAPAIVGADVTCPAECGPGAVLSLPQVEPDAGAAEADAGDLAPDAGAPPPPPGPVRPAAIALEPDGSRLYAGSSSSGALLVVDLDETGRPTAAQQLELEGAGGIRRLAASGRIEVGGIETNPSGTPFHFVYAIGADATIHVVDVTPGRAPRECDTQIDRRYLRSGVNRDLLGCFPVGRPQNPPRRASARGPGIRLPGGVVPLDLVFFPGTRPLSSANVSSPTPRLLFGTFVAVTAVGPALDARTRGLVYIINVDDDNYVDVEGSDLTADISLAIPHALRDANLARTVGLPTTDPPSTCAETDYASPALGPVRVSSVSLPVGFVYADTGAIGSAFAPNLHRIRCGDQVALYELSSVAPSSLRETLFADLEMSGPRSVEFGAPQDEEITVTWEGTLTYEPGASQRRGGVLTPIDSSRLDLRAPGGLLCGLGAEDGDIVRLVGCNVDADCAVGIETCVVHPDQPSGMNGLCMPTDRAGELTGRCRSLLVSSRAWTMTEVEQSGALLLARPDVLTGSPIEGCSSAQQCADIENDLLTRQETAEGDPIGTLPRHEFTCEFDPGMGGPPRCIPTCVTDADCEAGAVCAGERCVLAAIPDPACVSTLQRYEVRAGDSFIVQSSARTFQHRQKVDPETDRCVEDTSLSPLFATRVRRLEPPCGDLGPTGIAPNPCHVTDMMEPLLQGATIELRPTYGMRIRSPGVAFDIADVAVPLESAGGALVSPVGPGYSFRFTIAGGFQPYTFYLSAPLPERIRRGPDGLIWIVDSGDSSAALTRGQLLFMSQDGIAEIRLR